MASSAVAPAAVSVVVAVEQPTPVAGPLQVVPWTLVRGLTAADFAVFLDGKACPIEWFSTADAPLSMVVLLDVSASTEVTVDSLLEPLQTTLVRAFVPGDRVAFGRFGGSPTHVDRRFTSQPDAMKDAARAVLTPPPETPPVTRIRGLNGAFGLDASPIWDAVDEAVTVLESEPGRRAIILLTDGRSTGNVRSLDEAIRHAVAADVSVFVAGEGLDEEIYQDNWTVKAQVQPTVLLELLARTTGGACAPVFGPEKSRPKRIDGLALRPARERLGAEPLKPARIDEDAFKAWIGRMMAGFVDELRCGYTLGLLAPIADGQLHALDVRVRKTGLKVRARQRLIVPPTMTR